jgi:hypothetical protein
MFYKKLGLIYIFLFATCTFYAQINTNLPNNKNFLIKELGTKYTQNQLVFALEKADWCGYFNKTLNYKIIFDDGTIVELLSFDELKKLKSIELSDGCYQTRYIEDTAIYSIQVTGLISRQVKKNTNIKSFENN